MKKKYNTEATENSLGAWSNSKEREAFKKYIKYTGKPIKAVYY